jgi:hypothetical protein
MPDPVVEYLRRSSRSGQSSMPPGRILALDERPPRRYFDRRWDGLGASLCDHRQRDGDALVANRRADGPGRAHLSAGSEAPDVAAETARILGVRGASGTSPTDALRSYLRNRDVLLVLDNCEHVVDACAELAAALLSSCGDVRIMTASRESLRVEGETVWRLEPLAPEDAYRLFVERARRRRPEPTDQRPRLPSGRAPQPAGARAWTAVKAIVWVHQRGSAQWARNRSMSWSSTFAESTSRSRSSTTVWVQ